jgi:mannose-6-phosphate isomerase-like protein (cupin superfamily)
MRRILVLLAVGIGAVAGVTPGIWAQMPPAGAPAGPGQPPAQGRAGGPGEPPSNERTNVNIDRFIGHAINSSPRLSHGGLLTRTILRNGNPAEPGPSGAVLEFRTQVAKATLLPRDSTLLLSLDQQFLFYVVSGQGRLDDGTEAWNLHEGITMLIPQGVRRRFTNTADDPLDMIMVEWPANDLARKDILVRDVSKLPFCEESAHWNNMSKCIFSQEDGMTGRVLLVMLMPMTMAAPHTHVPGTDEFWTKLSPGSALIMLGSELREMPQYSAFLAPPDGQTWHAQLNTSKDRVETWLYVAGGAAGGRVESGMPAVPPGNQNPNLSRDPAVVNEANVPGTPIE